MREDSTTLVSQKLITIEDYRKQRERSEKDFACFMRKRSASQITSIENEEEKKRM